MDERDVTAMAYWYEALRHTPDRREEGTRGLEEAWQRFPSNEALTRFLTAVTLAESGDSSDVAEMMSRHRQELIDAMSEGWRVTWNWRIQQALARPVRIELATTSSLLAFDRRLARMLLESVDRCGHGGEMTD